MLSTNRTIPALALAIALSIPCIAAAADAQVVQGTMSGQVLAAGGGRVVRFAADGKVLWDFKGGHTHDAWMLPSGNVLYAGGEFVREVTPDKKIVFEYKPANQAGGGVYSCQRLENGNTLIGENSTGRVLEVDKDGKIAFQLQTDPAKEGEHHNLRMVRKLANGNYLVCHSGAHLVKEYTPAGKVVWEQKVGNIAFAAVRLASGNTVISSIDHVTEYDPKGTVVWDFANDAIAGVKISAMTGINVLPNGNVLIGCYAAYDKEGKGTGMLEITRDKKLVWRYANPAGDREMMGVQLLDADGKCLKGQTLR
jgi:outer membrane protein assembly factor BamB